MSVDIDWSLLSSEAANSLSDKLISAVNTQLNQASRPSFLGPITITSFDFGTVGPEVEIKDIRDVWRTFDEGDDEGDAILEAMENERLQEEQLSQQHSTPPPPASAYSHAHSHSASSFRRPAVRQRHSSTPPVPVAGRLLSTTPSAVSLNAQSLLDDPLEMMDDTNSVHSGFHSGRNSVASVGLGVHVLRRPRYPLGVPSTPPRFSPVPAGGGGVMDSARTGPTPLPDSAAPLSPPPSPPARPAGIQDTRPNPLPSAQLHLRLDHASNMSLTLLTSLQVNYPSPLFMALPLKLVITGLTLAADLVFAYSGHKHRLHITIVDNGDDQPPTPGQGHGLATGPYAIGQRILPNLHIESEIGSADAHVLRNVGKVERFIVDVVRKTLVDELVFPNFQTIAL